ncbi:DEAD/DEAH box helicase family protein [Brevundimonas sp. BT-123]|uniref:EcoAI/FtnUII family type I restriction enzme subunit R n=1 Tax=Brevundimonas sp. BT-123 TaxID=2986928 RepID=UPI0022358DB6|nr:type I restriction endonuclease subunit R [Brevundimonas sp. BT-123]MCW0047685.1 DEAD/DEAH box helicase family protein [Brevundimonas sp. BT-123]
MNESETRAELIDPALKAAGWGVVEDSKVNREVICPGRILGAGQRGEATTADYVLSYRGRKLAAVEAKAAGKGVTGGLGQAKIYAGKLNMRWAFSTDGTGQYRVDMATGKEGPVEAWPTPQELWDATFAEENAWRDRFAAVPFEDKGGSQPARYYQVNAVEAVLDAVAEGKKRVLLNLATGTGKTFIAFQLAWKLFHARWSLSGEPTRRPRILLLADRNILADQAYNSFSAFPDDALVRIKPDAIRKKGRVPKNGSVFFTIFQTFTSGKTDALGREEAYFGDYPPDFFDFIIIDECHRGGANAEGEWRAILEYFAPAVQLGLTATPLRRDENRDTYLYFGKPVYTYSLREGIEDGFLTPFKVRQHKTTLDDYVWTPDDTVVKGEVKEKHRYTSGQFNRTIEIEAREKYRVEVFMKEIDPRQKTLVFCATQDHAAAVRNLINQMKDSTDPHYCERVTADDGAMGEHWLRQFQDNEKTIPTILTTSQKLSTGVDARNVRHIVLLRPVNSMIEFKQIVGRGTRLYDGKEYFTIHDFEGAYQHFFDPEWDGEPMEPVPAGPKVPPPEDPLAPPTQPKEPGERPEKIVIKLADGKARTIQHISATSFWGPDGRPLSAAEFIQNLFGKAPVLFKDEDELRRLWGAPDTRKALMAALAEAGFGAGPLQEMARIIDAPNSDVFDVLAYVAFALPPLSRAERVQTRKTAVLADYDAPLATFLDFVLGQYVDQGVEELDQEKLPRLLELRYASVSEGAQALGGVAKVRDAFLKFQGGLFSL